MRDCEWINTQLASEEVRRRVERRADRRRRVARLLHLRRETRGRHGHQPSAA